MKARGKKGKRKEEEGKLIKGMEKYDKRGEGKIQEEKTKKEGGRGRKW